MQTELAVSSPSIPSTRARHGSFDNLKVVLVCGVIVGHATMAWTGMGTWVFDEPHVREPLLTLLLLVSVVGALFAIPVFFFVAGAFTPGSLQRKGPARFLIDRTLRLGIPMLFFVIVLSPLIEYVDPDNLGWDRGFWAFVPFIWWPPAPGPTWFLGVLLVFSAIYAVVRTIRPARAVEPGPPRMRTLVAAVAGVAVVSYLIRLAIPLGVEVGRLALGQTAGWVTGFALGVMGAERGWYQHLGDLFGVRMRRLALGALALCAFVIGSAAATGASMDDFAGGGTWQSLTIAVLEGALIVTMSLWLVEVFGRRFDHQGRLATAMSRAAYAAFLFHQLILVGLVLTSRWVPWAPEIEYGLVASLGVALSFGVGSLLTRLPGLSRVV
jgi:glucans biosynthesis protein C